jgi:hypothetical protein
MSPPGWRGERDIIHKSIHVAMVAFPFKSLDIKCSQIMDKSKVFPDRQTNKRLIGHIAHQVTLGNMK